MMTLLKRTIILSILSCSIFVSGCAGQSNLPDESADITTKDAIETEPIAVPTPDDEEIIVSTPEPERADDEEIIISSPEPENTDDSQITGDYIDLTVMSSTVVYGQVYNMMYYPENFIGKTIKMKGLYSDYFDQRSGKRYFACIIMDATACCSQGIEFILTDDYKYPDDYPAQGDEVTVEGVFDVYEEEDGSYCTLRESKLIF